MTEKRVSVRLAAAVAAGIAVVRSSLKTIDAQAKLVASLHAATACLLVLARAAIWRGVAGRG